MLLRMTLLCLYTTSVSSLAEARDSFRDLLSVYRCEVVHRLEQIYEFGDLANDRDRFIAITVPGHPHGYVQCMFHSNGTEIYCEASSGFYYDKENAPRIFRQPQRTIDALARLGFNTDDSEGNFQIDFAIGSAPDFNAIADFLLRALHDGYGARGQMNLKFSAPFAPRVMSTCVPVS